MFIRSNKIIYWKFKAHNFKHGYNDILATNIDRKCVQKCNITSPKDKNSNMISIPSSKLNVCQIISP